MNDELQWLGWLSSAILIATLIVQIRRQWQAAEPEGVSAWLFVGQIAASTGFVLYSLSVHDRVFVLTNSLILATAVIGQCLYLLRKRYQKPSTTDGDAPGNA